MIVSKSLPISDLRCAAMANSLADKKKVGTRASCGGKAAGGNGVAVVGRLAIATMETIIILVAQNV